MQKTIYHRTKWKQTEKKIYIKIQTLRYRDNMFNSFFMEFVLIIPAMPNKARAGTRKKF